MSKVPLKFQIFRGDELLKEEILAEAVIKVGKLASSHLRIDDESVSRMHAVIEVNGPDDVQLIDLGSTRGTLVNGQRITKIRLTSRDEIVFGEVRVVVTLLDDEATVVASTAAAAMASKMVQPEVPDPMASASVAPPPAFVRPPVVTPVVAPVAAPVPVAAAAPRAAAAVPAAAFSTSAQANPVAAEVEVHDGTRAIEVQALFRGVVMNTRHLYDPQAKATSGQAKTMMLIGAVCIAVALGWFLKTVGAVAAEKAAFEVHMAAGKDTKSFVHAPQTPVDDAISFGGIFLGLVFTYMGLQRRGKQSNTYLIGSGPEVDAPVGSDIVSASVHVLVAPAGGDFVVNVTPQMQGEVVTDASVVSLAAYAQQRGSSFSLPARARAKIDCGEATFLVSSTPKPRALAVPFLIWKWNEQAYTAGTAVALGLFLLMIFSVPPDPRSLSLDLFNADNRFVNFLIKPPEEKEEEIPEWLKKKSADEQGGKGKRHKGDEGKMGKKTSKNKEGLYGLKGPKDNVDPHLAKKLAEEAAKNAGILGVLKQQEGSHLASIFGRDTAVGSDAENVLGGLIGNAIGEAYGVGGLGLVGTGSGGGGTGEGTIGLGNLGTIGTGGGGGSGSGYGRGAGGLGGRRAKAPDVVPGQAAVRGSLDKEIIRRIIRRHINEVKYCYEQELTKKADLGGRVSVQFTIAASGQVMASVLQQTTMNSPRVENCVVQAVRRWEFPKPLGGGIVIVTYPFQFNPAGGGAE